MNKHSLLQRVGHCGPMNLFTGVPATNPTATNTACRCKNERRAFCLMGVKVVAFSFVTKLEQTVVAPRGSIPLQRIRSSPFLQQLKMVEPLRKVYLYSLHFSPFLLFSITSISNVFNFQNKIYFMAL